MKDDVLGAVVEVEKEIAGNLAHAKSSAAEFLGKLRSDSEKEILREEKRLQFALDKAVSEAVANSQKKASQILEDADAYANTLTTLSDDVLKVIIRKYIAGILP
jgi:vacuolar-type H+-ATPase subunit H